MSHHRTAAALAAAALALASPARAAETHAYVVTTDYSTGGLSAASLDTRAVASDVATVYSDAVLRWYQGRIYVVNRYGQDNIQVIDPAQGYATVKQFSVGNGSNPQDIAFRSTTKAYVSRLGSADLLIVNPTTGATLGTISLAAFADGDGLPEAARMVMVDHTLFVALQRLTNYVASNPSLVAAVDTDADTVLDADPDTPGTQAIPLVGRNPVTTFAFDRSTSRLLIGCAGNYGVLDGDIEWLDPVGLRDLGVAITEAALGGDVSDVVWRDAGRAFAIVSDASYNTQLVGWDPSTGALEDTLFAPGGFTINDAELDDRDELWMCNGGLTAPGLYVFDAATGALVAGPLGTGLPPYDLTFDDASGQVTGVPAPAAAGARIALSAPWPDPARARVSAALALGAPARARVEVLDLAGRRVRVLADRDLPAGRTTIEWDLRDARGRRVAPGVYLVRARAAGGLAVRRVAVTG